jgi:single-strand DNA-binding protein
MSAEVTIEGHLGQDPDVRFTPNGKAVTTLNLGCTASHQDRQSGEWVNDGDDLWIRAPFWGEEHTHFADELHKGDKVTVKGTLIRKVYTGRDDVARESLEVKFPRFLGVTPKIRNTGTYQQGRPGTTGYGSAPQGGSQDDPWATGGSTPGDEAPF